MTEPGWVALLLVAWLLAAVALLAAQGALVPFLAAVVPTSAVALVLRALVRQQRAPVHAGQAPDARAVPGRRRPHPAHHRGGRGRRSRGEMTLQPCCWLTEQLPDNVSCGQGCEQFPACLPRLELVRKLIDRRAEREAGQ